MSPSEVFADSARREEFFSLAARVFKVDRDRLGDETAYGSLTEWDSVNHLRLVMEAERMFGIKYPFERITSLAKLSDFFA